MTVALSILFAALVGGVVFMLLEGWERKRVAPAVTERTHEPAAVVWRPEREPPAWQPPSPEAETRPLPAWEPPTPRRESPPLWTPPPSRPSGRWDDDDRHRDEDDENRPPGLWSGWANR